MKNNSRFKIVVFILFCIGILSSCTKKNFTDFVGPSVCATDNFAYVTPLTLDNSTVNLASTPLTITAKFNEQVPWTILITGQTSGSYKKITGYGNSINIQWRGNPDTLVFFQAENCTVKLTVACKPSVTQTFQISTPNNFGSFAYLGYNGDGGALGVLNGAGPIYGYPQPPYTKVPPNPLNGATTIQHLNPASPQGGACLCTKGYSGKLDTTTSQVPVWYFGGFDINLPGIATHVKSDPNQVYFNCFINVQGSTATIPVIVFTEGVVQRSKEIFVYGSGWHYVSFKLSDADVGDPQNVSIVSFTLNSYPNKASSGEMCIDFINFTNDAPFINTTAQ